MYHSRPSSALYYYLILGVLIIFPFFNFSAQFYPLLNSDMAVNILMTPGFTIPGDLYFWGQDHGGSLVPMIAQVLCVTYHFPPILAVSLVQYLILIAGFFALATLLKERSLRIALALIWFFPAWHFLDHVLSLFGLQMSLIAVSIYFLNRLAQAFTMRARAVWLTVACFTFFLAAWVSDLAVFSILALIIGFAIFRRETISRLFTRDFFKDIRRLLLPGITLLWLILGTACILYAKSRAVRVELYHHNFLNSFWELITALKIIFRGLFQVLTFASGNMPESIYTWSILIGVPWIFFLTKRKKDPVHPFTQQRWLVFFFINGIVTLILLVISHWVFINGMNSKYFTIVYISFWVALLLYIQAHGSRNRALRLVLLFIIIVSGAFSSFYKFYIPGRIPPRAEELDEINSLGYAGLIADYKNAYVLAAPDPNHIKATPYENDHVRNMYTATEVFKQPHIYLVKDVLKSSFPDTLNQFGHILVRKGKMFHLAGYSLCQYSPLVLNEEFTWAEMKYQGIVCHDRDARNGQSVRPGPGFDKSKHFVFGPFISLSAGRVVVRFRMKASENLSTGRLAFLDISADYGKTILGSRMILPADFGRINAYQDFDVPLELTKRYDGIEFRILYLGKADLSFDRVVVRGN